MIHKLTLWLLRLLIGRELVEWIRPTLEIDGRASARRLTAFWFVVLTSIALFKYLWAGVSVEPHIWFGLLGMILLLLGIVTAEQVFTMWTNAKFGVKPKDTPVVQPAPDTTKKEVVEDKPEDISPPGQ